MSFAAVQKHVAGMERARLVTKQRRGRVQVVRGEIDTVRHARRELEQREDVWRGRIDQFGAVLADVTPDMAEEARHDRHQRLEGPEARTLTLTAAFAAPPEKVWPLWDDPRLLERWWAVDVPGDRRRPRPLAQRSGQLLHDRPGR
jgi:hypothetical protein